MLTDGRYSAGNYRQPCPAWVDALFGRGKYPDRADEGTRAGQKETLPLAACEDRPTHYSCARVPIRIGLPRLPNGSRGRKEWKCDRGPILVFFSFESLCNATAAASPSISEMGMAILDVDKLVLRWGETAPGKRGEVLQSVINSHHLIVREMAHHHTGKCQLPATCNDASHVSRMYCYAFGTSVFIRQASVSSELQARFDAVRYLGLSAEEVRRGVRRDVVICDHDLRLVEGVLAQYRPEFYQNKAFYQAWELRTSQLVSIFCEPLQDWSCLTGSQFRTLFPTGPGDLRDVAERMGLQTAVNNYSVMRNAGNDATIKSSLFVAAMFLNRKECRELARGKTLAAIRRTCFSTSPPWRITRAS